MLKTCRWVTIQSVELTLAHFHRYDMITKHVPLLGNFDKGMHCFQEGQKEQHNAMGIDTSTSRLECSLPTPQQTRVVVVSKVSLYILWKNVGYSDMILFRGEILLNQRVLTLVCMTLV